MGERKREQYWETADRSWSEDSVWLSNTPASSARQTFFYVQEVGYFHTVPPYYTKRANLNSFLVFCTLSGTGYLDCRGKTYVLGAGTVALVNCMEYHHYRCAPGDHWEFLWLHFNGPTALGYYEVFTQNGFHICQTQEPEFVQDTMRKILTLTQSKVRHSEILVSGLITELLTHLLILNSTDDLEPGIIPGYLKKVLKKIDNYFQESLCLDGLSQEFGVSKYHLSREFKRCTGTTVNEYLTVTRLNHAKELLKYTAKTVE